MSRSLLPTRYEPPDSDDDGLDDGEDAETSMTIPVEICLTSMECAQFQVSGIDVDALQAKAKATSVDGRRRALQKAGGGCTDATEIANALMAAINEAGAELT